MSLANESFTKKKNRWKKISVIFQILLLGIIFTFIAMQLFSFEDYIPYDEVDIASSDKGFITIAYDGISQEGDAKTISEANLRAQLTALKNAGYVTITQADIEAYYKGKNLPEKALFLLFEDGKKSTIVFADKLLRELNFKGSLATYSENLGKRDFEFLTAKDILDLKKNSYWEQASNGHRLSFINVFNANNEYLGEREYISDIKFFNRSDVRYNHYLMDYLRDEDGQPKETYAEMKERINFDYEEMQETYNECLGYIPRTHVLMHANTERFGNEYRVSFINEYWIKRLFAINFNREGKALNTRKNSIYDLTRLRSKKHWTANQLIMHLNSYEKQSIPFVNGDKTKYKAWQVINGALEANNEKLTLTTLPTKVGRIRLRNSKKLLNSKFTTLVNSDEFGAKRIYFRADDKMSRYVSVAISEQKLYVNEKINGKEQLLKEIDLSKYKNVSQQSGWLARNMKTNQYLRWFIIKYEYIVTNYFSGTRQYIVNKWNRFINDETTAKTKDTLAIEIEQDNLSVNLDGIDIIRDLKIKNNSQGYLLLESKANKKFPEHKIYNGVFEKTKVIDTKIINNDGVIFDANIYGLDYVKLYFARLWEKIVILILKSF